MGKIRIDQIENIIIQQGNKKYKLIHKNEDWIFIDLKSKKENGGYTKRSAYKIVLSNSTKVANLEYTSNEVEMSVVNMATLSSVVSDLKSSQNLKAKIHSYAFSDSGNMSDARRTSLQRAIKIRKYLIDNDISASRISVNAIEDSNSRMNKVEIQLAETN